MADENAGQFDEIPSGTYAGWDQLLAAFQKVRALDCRLQFQKYNVSEFNVDRLLSTPRLAMSPNVVRDEGAQSALRSLYQLPLLLGIVIPKRSGEA